MYKKWGVAAVAVAVAAIGWNEYRLWNERGRDLSSNQVCETHESVETPVPAEATRSGEEESEQIPIIDLTALQRSANDVPPNETTEPALLPAVHVEPAPGVLPRGRFAPPPQFLPFAADASERKSSTGPVATFWRKLTAFVWRVPAPMPEALAILPRPIPDYHRDHPTCTFPGNGIITRGSFKQSGSFEEQSAPPTSPRKRADTLEIRIGDVPIGWWYRPF